MLQTTLANGTLWGALDTGISNASNKTAAGRSQNRRVEIHIDVPEQVAQQ